MLAFSLAGEYDGVCSSDCREAAVWVLVQIVLKWERSAAEWLAAYVRCVVAVLAVTARGTMDESLGSLIACG